MGVVTEGGQEILVGSQVMEGEGRLRDDQGRSLVCVSAEQFEGEDVNVLKVRGLDNESKRNRARFLAELLQSEVQSEKSPPTIKEGVLTAKVGPGATLEGAERLYYSDCPERQGSRSTAELGEVALAAREDV